MAYRLYTSWGKPESFDYLNDYSAREYSEFLLDYYLARWKKYIDYLLENFETGNSVENIDWYSESMKFVEFDKVYSTTVKTNLKSCLDKILEML